MKLGIWLVRQEAEPLAMTLASALKGSIQRPWLFQTSGKSQFEQLFFNYDQWVLIMASGIAVRYLQGLPKDKHTDPAVVVLDEKGRYAIALLSGHEGGANGLAYDVANLTGALPVITTATETHKPLIIGIGCRKGIAATQIAEAVFQGLHQVHRGLEEVRVVATIDLKATEPGLQQWCATHQLPLHAIKQELVSKRPWVSQSSKWVQQTIGVEGVCEPCALLASIRGHLILKKTAWKGVTVAIVEDP